MNEIKEYTEKMFENIKHIDENGNEYWSARELQNVLQYKEWRKFEGVINKAKKACENSNIKVFEQFDGYTLSDVAISSHLGFSLVESSISFHMLALIAPGLPV